MNDIYILGGARTPMGEYTGKLKDFSALELGAIAARAAMERTGVKPEAVEHVVFGNVLQTSADAVYGARHVGLKAGLPIEVPALTVNRLCGSGIQAAVSGAQMIRSRRGRRRAHRRHGEHEPGAARHPRVAQRTAARSGAARGHAVVGAARHALRLHDGGHGRELRRQVRRVARGAGSLRHPQPAARREGLERRTAWPGSRPGRDQVAQRRGAVRAGRPHAPGFDDGGAGEAAGGVQQERLRDGGQRLRDRRWRRRVAAGVGARRQEARADAARDG